MRGFMCGVPQQYCRAGYAQLNSGLKNQVLKAHVSPEDAFRCHAGWLVNVCGFTRVGSREFAPSDGGPIRVLSKKSHFGGVLRLGKNEKRLGKRLMPKEFTGGIIALY